MQKKITVDEYFRLPETNRPMELIYGYVREPPAPFGEHQLAVTRITGLLDAHTHERDLGRVFVAPMDVVLDRDADLIVQPDVCFISRPRLSILRGRIWGPPDLVVEVASPGTEHHDRTLKLAWYRRYGVKECWLVYTRDRRIEIVDGETNARKSFAGHEHMQSKVLPEFDATAEECLG